MTFNCDKQMIYLPLSFIVGAHSMIFTSLISPCLTLLIDIDFLNLRTDAKLNRN